MENPKFTFLSTFCFKKMCKELTRSFLEYKIDIAVDKIAMSIAHFLDHCSVRKGCLRAMEAVILVFGFKSKHRSRR